MSTTEAAKDDWVAEYAKRIAEALHKWQGPLGIDERYSEHLKAELSEYYDDPLKRGLIESTY
jgi:hypothetical protein